jgi:hypothetical protein
LFLVRKNEFGRNTSSYKGIQIWSLCSKKPTQLSWWNSCIFPMPTVCVQCMNSYHIGSLWDLAWFLKWIPSATQAIQDGDRLSFFQIGLFRWVEEKHVSLNNIPFVLEVAACSILFPCDICVTYWN